MYRISNEDEFEPRITPKPAAKLDYFALPSVPEVSLIFDKPHAPIARPKTPSRSSATPPSTPPSTYAAWRHQNFSLRPSRTPRPPSTTSQGPRTPDFLDGEHLPSRASATPRSSFRAPSKASYASDGSAEVPRPSVVPARSTRLVEGLDVDSAARSELRGGLEGPVELRGAFEEPTELRGATRDSYGADVARKDRCNLRSPCSDANGHGRSPRPGANERSEGQETVRNLLRLVSSQNEQIRRLQLQVDKLLRMQEQALRDKARCACGSASNGALEALEDLRTPAETRSHNLERNGGFEASTEARSQNFARNVSFEASAQLRNGIFARNEGFEASAETRRQNGGFEGTAEARMQNFARNGGFETSAEARSLNSERNGGYETSAEARKGILVRNDGLQATVVPRSQNSERNGGFETSVVPRCQNSERSGGFETSVVPRNRNYAPNRPFDGPTQPQNGNSTRNCAFETSLDPRSGIPSRSEGFQRSTEPRGALPPRTEGSEAPANPRNRSFPHNGAFDRSADPRSQSFPHNGAFDRSADPRSQSFPHNGAFDRSADPRSQSFPHNGAFDRSADPRSQSFPHNGAFDRSADPRSQSSTRNLDFHVPTEAQSQSSTRNLVLHAPTEAQSQSSTRNLDFHAPTEAQNQNSTRNLDFHAPTEAQNQNSTRNLDFHAPTEPCRQNSTRNRETESLLLERARERCADGASSCTGLRTPDAQPKKTFVEQKVSIGVMTSFEFTVQNSPFAPEPESLEGAFQTQADRLVDLPDAQTWSGGDAGEAPRRYKTSFARMQGAQLENIVEDSESYLSSQQQSSNLNGSASIRDLERNGQEAQRAEEEAGGAERVRRFGAEGIRRAERGRCTGGERLERPGTPEGNDGPKVRGASRDPKTNQRLLHPALLTPETQKGVRAPGNPRSNHPFDPSERSGANEGRQRPRRDCAQENGGEGRRSRAAGRPEESLVLSGGDLRVDEGPPPTPEPSIHVEMNEYSSDEESDKVRRTSKVGWTFYNNVLGQVNQILQSSGAEQRQDGGEGVCGGAEEDRVLDTVKVATLEQLKRLGISLSEGENREGNGNKKMEYDSSFYPRLDCQAMTHSTSAVNETNTSMHMKALALKYLSDEQLAELALQRQGSASLKQLMVSNVQGTNMSFATMRYLERYQLLPGKNNQQMEGSSKIHAEIPAKGDPKFPNAKGSPTLQRFPFGQTPRTTCPSKILDISTLKQQPKLL